MAKAVKFLGETPITNFEGTPFEGFDKEEWIRYYLESYSGIDGSHHKAWVFDQIMRILCGTKVKVRLAKWSNGVENYRVDTGRASAKYKKFVADRKAEGYDWDEGIAP